MMHVGVLGVGRIGALHTRNLVGLVDRITVWDPRSEAVSEVQETSAVEVAGSPVELFGSGLDAVLICSSSVTHAELLTEAVRRGVPAFCEKPVATGLAETRHLAALVDSTRAKVTVGFQRRSDPPYRVLKEQIEDGQLGRLYLARLVVGDDAPPPAEYVAGSGGLFTDQSVHDFDILRHLTGQEVVEVYSVGTALTGAPGFGEAEDADTAVTLLKLSEGTLASLTSSRHSVGGYDVRLEVAGSKGIRAVGLTTPTAEEPADVRMPDGGFLTRFAAAYQAEIVQFLEFVGDRGDNPCSVQDAVAALEIADAATRSSRSGKPVRLLGGRVDG
jgi:myo-inositol 2-dehydrogenase/D-chiro-inositol 1-dehydrogenase